MPLRLSGATTSVQEATLELPNKPSRHPGRQPEPPLDELNPRVRLKLCLQGTQEVCSDYTEAESK